MYPLSTAVSGCYQLFRARCRHGLVVGDLEPAINDALGDGPGFTSWDTLCPIRARARHGEAGSSEVECQALSGDDVERPRIDESR